MPRQKQPPLPELTPQERAESELKIHARQLQAVEFSALRYLEGWHQRLQRCAEDMQRAQQLFVRAQSMPINSRERATEMARIIETAVHDVMWLMPNLGLDYGLHSTSELQLQQREVEAAVRAVEQMLTPDQSCK